VSGTPVTYVSDRSPTTCNSGLLLGQPKGARFVADRFRLILFLFFLGIRYGFDSLGDRIDSLFLPALAVNILGHVDIRVTHVVPHNLRP
jgi:hypothetical protein